MFKPLTISRFFKTSHHSTTWQLVDYSDM